MKRRGLKRLLAIGVGAVAALLGWLFLGPAQLGGTTSYAAIVGNSMEPMLHQGDLAIVREQPSYRPGDVVLYESRDLGSKVLHRILRVEAGRYVMQGDNNDFVDVERPTEAQLVGKLWVNLGSAGRAAGWIREPTHAATIVGLSALFALGGGGGLGALLGRRRRRPVQKEQPPARAPGPGRPLDPRHTAVALAVAATLCALLALASFTRPADTVEVVEEAYVHGGTLDYAASVRPSAAYPDGEVSTGEPIFLRLVPRLRFSFAYALESRAAPSTEGTIALEARISDGRGWQSVVPLAAAKPFTGPAATTSGTLDVAGLQRLVDRLRALTGSAQASYAVEVVPRVAITGTAGGEAVDDVFAPAVRFDFGDLRLQPSIESTGAGVGPFSPRQPASGTRTVPAELALGPVTLPVRTARAFSLIGLLAALALLALLGPTLAGRRRAAEPERIAADHGHLIVPLAALPHGLARATDVADMASLVRLAEHHDRMILHVAQGDEHTYLVEESGTAYRYRTRGDGEPVMPDAPVALVPEQPAEEPESLENALNPSALTPGALIPGGGGRRYGGRSRSRFGGRSNRDEDW